MQLQSVDVSHMQEQDIERPPTKRNKPKKEPYPFEAGTIAERKLAKQQLQAILHEGKLPKENLFN